MWTLASMFAVTLQENVMWFLDDVNRYLIGLFMCAFAMMLVFCAGFMFSKLIDLISGE